MSKTQIATGGIADDAVTAAKATGFGKIAQAQTTVTTTTSSTSSTSFTDVTNLTVNITPSASDSKILIMLGVIIRVMSQTSEGNVSDFQVLRDSTSITQFRLGNREANNEQRDIHTSGYHILDSPSTTSQVTYKLQMKKVNGDQVQINDGSKQSHITVLELLA